MHHSLEGSSCGQFRSQQTIHLASCITFKVTQVEIYPLENSESHPLEILVSCMQFRQVIHLYMRTSLQYSILINKRKKIQKIGINVHHGNATSIIVTILIISISTLLPLVKKRTSSWPIFHSMQSKKSEKSNQKQPSYKKSLQHLPRRPLLKKM